MPLPRPAVSDVFSADQRLHFRARYWDTTTTAVRLGPMHGDAEYTASGHGIQFAIFDLKDPTFAPTSRTQIEAALINPGQTECTLGYTPIGNYRSGVTPNLYMYWGAGAPAGGSRAKQVLLKFSGYVREDVADATLIFAGQGTVHVYRNGANTALLTGTLREPEPLVNLRNVTADRIRSEWGYVFNTTPVNLVAGDLLEIYYWHNGEPWGGICGKVFPGAVTQTADTFLSEVREAAVIGTSFLGDTIAPLDAVDVPYLAAIEMHPQANAVSDMRLTVALTTTDEPTGFALIKDGGTDYLRDNANAAIEIRRGRVMHIETGFRHADGTDELYGRFTGFIDDILTDDDTAVLTLKSFDARLAEPFDENTPDRLAYHANGFILRERASEPVFGITAFDYWPLSLAIQECALRAGVDVMSLGRSCATPLADLAVGKWRFVRHSTGQLVYGHRMFSASMLADSDEQIPIEHNANYGNVLPLQKDALQKDDPYLFPPMVTQRLYDRAKALSDHYGYDFFTNAEGQFLLTGRNNPVYFQPFTRNGEYGTFTSTGQQVAVSAVAGIYYRVRHQVNSAWTKVIEGDFSRLDLYVGIGIPDGDTLNGGIIRCLVEARQPDNSWVTVQTSFFSTFYEGNEGFYYDSLVRMDGTNAAVFRAMSLPFDHYRVTFSGAGPDNAEADCWYRVNGVALYERDPERSYFNADRVEHRFSTLEGALTLKPESTFKDLRNQVIVVGGRKATLTDSSKLNNESGNPNNPEYEFHVSVGVDPFSIYDPGSANFVGGKRMTVIFDDKVNDSDFARWLTRTILFEYREPKVNATMTHTPLPMLELRDALWVVEERHLSVAHRLWVQSFTERWSLTKDGAEAATEIQLLSTPAIPSYQPREDVDIDALFRRDQADDHSGIPVINVKFNYRNLVNRVVTNTHLSDKATIKAFSSRPNGRTTPMISESVTSGTAMTLTQPAIAETMFLGQNVWVDPSVGLFNVGSNIGEFLAYILRKKRALVNNPYRHFFDITAWNGALQPTLTFRFEEGDGTAGVYDKAFYEFPGGGDWYVNYDYLIPRLDRNSLMTENPFYDPYASEAGHLIEITFDALVSGRYRLCLYDANKQVVGFPTPVAWLTLPVGEPTQEDAHWLYMEAGARKTFYWDGVDNIGFWNVIQTSDLAEELKGAFGDRPNTVGRGFYAANDMTTDRHTFIGDASILGGVAVNFDADGAPYYTIGQYGQFMLKIEVMNDKLARRDLTELGRAEPRTVWTEDLAQTAYTAEGGSTVINNVSELYVWTHLGEPSQVAIRIQDWVGSPTWTPQTSGGTFGEFSTPGTDATIRVGQPVRFTFVPQVRRSPFFIGTNGVAVKLTREVHLKATIFDQFWTFYGKPWEEFHSSYSVSGTEQRRLTNRMFHNEDNTLAFEDGSWRTGEQLALFEWIFDPTLFEKDFGRGSSERLRYGDYEQLEALPGFDVKKLGGTATGERSAMLMAFMSYLMYFSAFTIDKSGRRQWCLDSWTDEAGQKRGFVDKSKIVTPTWRAASGDPTSGSYTPHAIVEHSTRDAERYLTRSIFVRQWKEPGWLDGSYTGSPVSKYAIPAGAQRNFVQPTMKSFDVTRGELLGTTVDRWTQMYNTEGSGVNLVIQQRSTDFGDDLTGGTADDLPRRSIMNIPTTTYGITALGTWTFDRSGVEGWFVPAPARDFRPYWRYPFMPDWAIPGTNRFVPTQWYNALDVLASTSSTISFSVRDPAAQQNWYGFAYAHSFAETTPGRYLNQGDPITYFYHGARCEKSVQEAGAEDPTKVSNAWFPFTTTEIPYLYDYVKQDELDRFDQFRGVISRAPFPDRKDAIDPTWWDDKKKRATSTQPVKAAGVYFLNLARYTDYALAAVHFNPQFKGTRMHWTEFVTDWADARFSHEYVWQSPRFFPVTTTGGAVYAYTKDEYTKISRFYGAPWWGNDGGLADLKGFDPTNLLYDAGAWAGWKADIPTDAWGTDPHLRWREILGTSKLYLAFTRGVCLTGGFGDLWASAPTGIGPVNDKWGDMIPALAGRPLLAPNTTYRANLFDDWTTRVAAPRLAVGPEVPEATPVIMNLVLPERLIGT